MNHVDISEQLKYGMGGKAPHPHQVDGVWKVLEALRAGQQDKLLLYYAPRTGKTFVQAGIIGSLMRLAPSNPHEAGIRLIVVVNDREALDTQSLAVVQEYIERLQQDAPASVALPKSAMVLGAGSSTKLKSALELGKRRAQAGQVTAVLTTLQKFGTQAVSGGGYSVGIPSQTLVMPDEVHRSHSELGALSQAMKAVLGGPTMAARNALRFVALTGTPSPASLESYGSLRQGASGPERVPFHTFHLGQAVSQSRVLDPRSNFCEVASVLSAPFFAELSQAERGRLQRLALHSDSDDALAQRIDFVVRHYSEQKNSVNTFVPQGMVVCSSRHQVIRATKLARKVASAEPQLGVSPRLILGAFSDGVEYEGISKERDLNYGGSLSTVNDAREAQLLVVAHKYETGYDNPSLSCLYILRKLSGPAATQVLLRHCGKRVGKSRPITFDFASEGGASMQAMSTYFGDVSLRCDGSVVATPPSGVSAGSARPAEPGGASRRMVEQLLLGKVRCERLEARPVATPMRHGAEADDSVHVFSGRKVTRPRHAGDAPIQRAPPGPSVRDAILLLKTVRDVPVAAERAALQLVVAKAGSAPLRKPMLSYGASAAIQQVISFGEQEDIQQAIFLAEQLKDLDKDCEYLVRVRDRLGALRGGSPLKIEEAARDVAATLATMPHLGRAAARLGAGTAALGALLRFSQSGIPPPFGLFDMMMGREEDTVDQAVWNIVKAVADWDADSKRVFAAKLALEMISRGDVGKVAQLADIVEHCASELHVRTLLHLDADDTMLDVMVNGRDDCTQHAVRVLKGLSRYSEQAAFFAELPGHLKEMQGVQGPLNRQELVDTLMRARREVSGFSTFDTFMERPPYLTQALRVFLAYGLQSALLRVLWVGSSQQRQLAGQVLAGLSERKVPGCEEVLAFVGTPYPRMGLLRDCSLPIEVGVFDALQLLSQHSSSVARHLPALGATKRLQQIQCEGDEHDRAAAGRILCDANLEPSSKRRRMA